MAKMIPRELPEFEGQSSAERLVYRELRDQLPEDYLIFYSVGFLTTRDRGHNTDREIDFLIVHPERCGVVVEVKGGGIHYSRERNLWASEDRHGDLHTIKNPFEQASTNMYALQDALRRHSNTRSHTYMFNWQVVLPSVTGARDRFGLQAQPETVIDSTDLNDLQSAVERAANPLPDGGTLSKQALRALVDTLAPTVRAPADGLGYHLLTTQQRLIELTGEQTRLLDVLERHRRVGIAGCCGSGKTMLALEKTRRLVDEGKRVLLTCFNAHLADWLRRELEEEGLDVGGRVVCQHYHGLVRSVCAETGVEIPPEPEDRHEVSTYYSEVYPDCLDRAIQRLSPEQRFDAIAADEGQDFSELWWMTLDSILKEPSSGIFYIFYDENQRIYEHTGELPVPQPHFPLSRNCRNTDEIHAVVKRFYQGEQAFEPGGVSGREPEFIEISSPDGVAELRTTLHRLINVDRIPVDDVTILSPVRTRGGSALSDGMKIGNHTRRRTSAELERGEIRLSTIHSFKGLESPVVIMTEVDKLADRDPGFNQGLLYVGLSRASSHLIVLGELPTVPAEDDPVQNRYMA